MKKIIFLALFLIPTIVSAECSYEEQNNLREEAELITVDYEIIEEEVVVDQDLLPSPPPDGEVITEEVKYIDIKVLNLTEKFYLVLEETASKDKITITYEDLKEDVYTYRIQNISDVYNYNYRVYSNNETDCPNEIYLNNYLSTPRYNKQSTYGACVAHSEEEICQEFVTHPVMTDSEFFSAIEKLNQDKTDVEENNENQQESDNQHFILIISLVLAVIVGIIIVIIFIKKRKKINYE